MALKRITELPLIGTLLDTFNFGGDNTIQAYRATAAQIKAYVLAAGNVGTNEIANEAVTQGKLSTAVQGRLGGNLLARYVYTSNDTYSKNANAAYIRVIVVGGGGGGGGTKTTGAGENSSGGGGGGGGYSDKIIANASVGSTETVTVGAGGTAGATSGGNGGGGGTSSFGSHCQATGGGGGNGCADVSGTAFSPGGAGGVGSGGDINIAGAAGMNGIVYSGGRFPVGNGGSSVLGGGALQGTASQSQGATGGNYGGGGSGALITQNTTHVTGGAGAPGIVIVEEYA